jgi:hypothetical protein
VILCLLAQGWAPEKMSRHVQIQVVAQPMTQDTLLMHSIETTLEG